jgi:adenosine kinase
MNLLLTGSIATDYLMSFAGRFADQLMAGHLDRLALSFLVDDLVVRRGGVAGNIAYALGRLGLRPTLVAAVGMDFDDYRSWLERHGVNTSHVHVSDVHHTARFFCTTDESECQIASFYTGAMAEARTIELGPVVSAVGPVDLVLVSPNDPEAMRRHTDECRQRAIPFAADPSQQLARLDGDEVAPLVTGARYLFVNDYERALILSKTGWSDEQLVQQVGTCVTTHGADGCVIERAGEEAIAVPAAPVEAIVDPTGVGDAFRGGFLAGQAWGLGLERSAQLGHVLASVVLEQAGTQEYDIEREPFLHRLRARYGEAAADEVGPRM